MIKSLRRLIAVGATLGFAGLGVAAAAVPASAAAVCPQGHICFYAFQNETGSMSDQTRLVSGPDEISNFANSHFTNGTILAGNVTSVVNNSPWCLNLFPGTNFSTFIPHNVPAGAPRQEEAIMAPGSRLNFPTSQVPQMDNASQSAYTYGESFGACDGDVDGSSVLVTSWNFSSPF